MRGLMVEVSRVLWGSVAEMSTWRRETRRLERSGLDGRTAAAGGRFAEGWGWVGGGGRDRRRGRARALQLVRQRGDVPGNGEMVRNNRIKKFF